jgi:hypothetical protein
MSYPADKQLGVYSFTIKKYVINFPRFKTYHELTMTSRMAEYTNNRKVMFISNKKYESVKALALKHYEIYSNIEYRDRTFYCKTYTALNGPIKESVHIIGNLHEVLQILSIV